MEKSDLDKIELWKQMLPDMELAEDQRKERAREFLRLMTYYKCAMMELETRINLLNEEYLLTHDRAPVSTIKTRLKTPQSIKEKLERQGLPFTYQAVMENLHDIAGVRVICAFTGDVYTLADALFRQDDIQLIRVKDYIAQPKPNGYRSLHMIVSVPIYLANEKRRMQVEVQLRTIAMDCWASLEHQLRYKRNRVFTDEMANELQECARMSAQLDQKMEALRQTVGQSDRI